MKFRLTEMWTTSKCSLLKYSAILIHHYLILDSLMQITKVSVCEQIINYLSAIFVDYQSVYQPW